MMNKNIYLFILIIVVSFLLGCSSNNENEEIISLSSPNLTINDNGLASWESVDKADYYIYRINHGDEVKTYDNSIQLNDQDTIVVKSVSELKNVNNSIYSKSLQYKRRYNAKIVDWDGSILYEKNILSGNKIVYNSPDPIRESKDDIDYYFYGYDFDLSEPITKDITINAQYLYIKENMSYNECDVLVGDNTFRICGFDEGIKDLYVISSYAGKLITKFAIDDEYIDNLVNLESLSFSDFSQVDFVNLRSAPNLRKVELPSTIFVIGDYAFSDCLNLEEVVIPDDSNLQYIGSYAFYNCGISSINLRHKYEEAEYPTECLTIMPHAFEKSKIEVLSIPSNSIVYQYAFANSSLRKVAINNNVYFDYYHPETDIIFLGLSYLSICVNPFINCTDLNEIVLNDERFELIDGVLYLKYHNDYFLMYYPSNKKEELFIVPKKVTSISNYAFYDNKYLKHISFEDQSSCKIIGEAAFAVQDANDAKLESIALPDALTTIGPNAFYNQNKIVSIDLFNTTAFVIGESAFENCSALENFILPNVTNMIYSRAFANCIKLNSIYIPKTVEYAGAKIFDGNKNLKIYLEAYAVPEGWRSDWKDGTNASVEYGAEMQNINNH